MSQNGISVDMEDTLESRVYSYGEGVDKETIIMKFNLPAGSTVTKEQLDESVEKQFSAYKDQDGVELDTKFEGSIYTLTIKITYTKDNLESLTDAGVISGFSKYLEYVSLNAHILSIESSNDLTCE